MIWKLGCINGFLFLKPVFIPPPHHCVMTKGSALTLTDRVHRSDDSASFASVHIRTQSHTVAAATAAACPYALAHFPACFRGIEGRRRVWMEMRGGGEGLRMGLNKRKRGWMRPSYRLDMHGRLKKTAVWWHEERRCCDATINAKLVFFRQQIIQQQR